MTGSNMEKEEILASTFTSKMEILDLDGILPKVPAVIHSTTLDLNFVEVQNPKVSSMQSPNPWKNKM